MWRTGIVLAAACSAGVPQAPISAGGPSAGAAPDSDAIGSADPLALIDMAPDARWLAICQARADSDGDGAITVDWTLDDALGDRFRPYLVWGSGLGEPIDGYLGRSADARWIAVVRGRRVEAIDTATRAAIELPGADLHDDGSERGPRRAVAFAPRGDRVIYLRGAHGRDVVVIRELRTGAERVVDPRATTWRVEVDDGGRWARLSLIAGERAGAARWPRHSSFPFDRMLRCLPWRGRLHDDGAPVTTAWLDLETGALVDDRRVVVPVGDRLLRDVGSGRLTLDDVPLGPAGCELGIAEIAIAPPRVLATCRSGLFAPPSSRRLWILGDGGRRATDLQVYDQEVVFPPYDVPIATTAEQVICHGDRCIDLATGRAVRLPGSVWHRDGRLALLHVDPAPVFSETRWYAWDLAAQTGRLVAGAQGDAIEGPHGPRFINFGTLYDLRTARPVAIAAGFAVVGDDLAHRRYVVQRTGDTGFAPGPLHLMPID